MTHRWQATIIGLAVLVAALLGAVIYVAVHVGIEASGASSQAATAAKGAQDASNRALRADSTATLAARDAKQGLANFQKLSAQRRAQNQRTLRDLRAQTAANHALTLRLSHLATQRSADNARAIARESDLSAANRREVIALADAQAKIAALAASQQHASLVAQHDTCVQVENVKTAVRFTLATIFAGQHLTPEQQRGLDRILAQFKPRVCAKP